MKGFKSGYNTAYYLPTHQGIFNDENVIGKSAPTLFFKESLNQAHKLLSLVSMQDTIQNT